MKTSEVLTEQERASLAREFSDLLNYESDDVLAPIDPLSYVTPEGDTCLHIAAQRGNLEAVALLVRAGVSVNARGDIGATPLHCATTAQVWDFLVSHGADLNARDGFGRLPTAPARGEKHAP
jgi:ankyrin repeat protein